MRYRLALLLRRAADRLDPPPMVQYSFYPEGFTSYVVPPTTSFAHGNVKVRFKHGNA